MLTSTIRSSLIAFAVGSLVLCAAGSARAATRYVFTTFTGDAANKQNLSVYTSPNGLDFTLLSTTGYAGPTAVLRDPSIMKHSDGKYYIAYTLQSWTTTSASFAIASSTDLKNWTFRAEVPAEVPMVKYTWAPEWFKDTDGSIHLIVSIDPAGSADSDFRSYLYTASDDTLTQWGAPEPLGIGPNYIDTFVVKVGAKYHAFTKNETSKFIEHATASALTGPWAFVGTGNWAGWGSGKEGPALFQTDDGQWRILMDCYGGCGFLQATSANLDTWSAASIIPGGLSGVVRHGTVLREETEAGGAAGKNSGGMSHGGTASAGMSSGGMPSGGVSHGGTNGAGVNEGGSVANAGTPSEAGTAGSVATVSNGGSGSGGRSGPVDVMSEAGSSASAPSISGSSSGCSYSTARANSTTTNSAPAALIAMATLAWRRRNRRVDSKAD